MRELFDRLEGAIARRNPALAARLRPGLTEYRIRKMLDEGKVTGALDPVVALFSWKNGTLPNTDPALGKPAFFPASEYMLPELNFMISDFRKFEEMSMSQPQYAEVIDRFFPLFWNGSADFIAVDLDPAGGGKIVIIERKAEKLVRAAYPSFENFLQDAIRANENNEPLACFPSAPMPPASQPLPAPKPDHTRRTR